MDFWLTYQNASKGLEFGGRRMLLNTSDRLMTVDRHHTSQSMVEGKLGEIHLGEATTLKLSSEERYLVASDITFDLLLTIYDVNSFELFVLRESMPLNRHEKERIRSFVGGRKRPNMELRAIGMQNGDRSLAQDIAIVKKIANAQLVEVDLFGTDTRHIVVDAKTGSSYNLLLLNRIYRPGELGNTTTMEDFLAKRSKLKFV